LARPHVALAAIVLAVSLTLAFPATSALAAPASDSVATLYEDALVRYEKRDFPGALIQIKNALQRDPNFLPAQMLAGKTYLALGKAADAEHAFNLASQLGVARSEVVPLLAQALLEQGKHSELLQRIDVSGLSGRVKADTLVLRAYAQIEVGNSRQAAATLDEAQRIDARAPNVAVGQANLALRQRDLAAARAHAERAVGLAPQDARAWNIKGSVVHRQGDTAGALADYTRSVELDPDYAEPRLARAALYLELGRDREADADLAKVHTAAPNDPRANYLRAVTEARKGNTKAVAEALRQVVRATDALSPDALVRKPQFLLLGGLGYYGLGEQEKAKSYLQRFTAAVPEHPGARKLLATLYMAERDYARVLAVLEPLAKGPNPDGYALSVLAAANLALNRRQAASELLERALQAPDVDPNLRASMGFTMLGTGKLDSGLEHLRRAFKANPDSIQAGTAVAVLEMKRGQTKAAVQTAETLAKHAPKHPGAHNLLGVTQAAAGNRTAARAAYEKALALDPAFSPAELNLAKLDAAEGKWDAGRGHLAAVLKREPKNGQAMFESARLERAAGRLPEAVRWMEKLLAAEPRNIPAGLELVDLHLALKQPQRALAVAKGLEAWAPERLDVLGALGRAYLAAGERNNARLMFDRMTRLAGFDPDQQTLLARYQLAAGNPVGARYNLEKALTGNPDALSPLVLQVELELADGNFAKAEQAARRVAGRYPDQPVTPRLLGDVAAARGDYAAAVKHYQAAYDKGRDADTALRLARAQAGAGQTRQATELLTRAWREQPGQDTMGRALAEFHLRAGDLPAAQRVYEQLLVSWPNDPVVLNNLAEILHRLKNPGALAYAERAYQAAPQDAVTNDTLGWILVQQGQPEKGLRYLREARLRGPQNRNIRYHLAYALAKTGRTAEARAELNAVLGDNVNFETANEARQLLAQLPPR
jgi:putative PEP-CTERM system TPR-repeat lipoprotein